MPSLTRTLAHNTGLQIAGKIISTLLGLLAIGLMTRSLGTEQFGWYVTATGFLQFVGILSDFGFTVTVSNLLSEPRFNKQTVLNTTFAWRVLSAAVFQGLAPVVFLFFPYPWPVKLAVFITTFSFFAIAVGNVFIGYFRAELKMLPATLAEVAGRIVLVGGIAAVAYGGANFLPMMAAISVASLTTTVILFWKSLPARWQIDGAVSRAMFAKMWPTALAIIFNSFYLQGDRVILPLYVSATDVGFYGVAYRVVDVVLQVSAVVMGLIMPLVAYSWSRGRGAEFRARYQLGFDVLSMLLIPMLAGIFVLARPIMTFIAGREFAPAGPILRGLAVCILGVCFGQTFGHIALAINRQRQVLWVYVSDAILSVIGYFIFIPRYGVWGAIGVTIFSEWYAGICLFAVVAYYCRVMPRLRTLAKIVAASLVMGAALYQLTEAPLGSAIVIGGVVFLGAAFALRIISPATMREVLRLKPVASEIEI